MYQLQLQTKLKILDPVRFELIQNDLICSEAAPTQLETTLTIRVEKLLLKIATLFILRLTSTGPANYKQVCSASLNLCLEHNWSALCELTYDASTCIRYKRVCYRNHLKNVFDGNNLNNISCFLKTLSFEELVYF